MTTWALWKVCLWTFWNNRKCWKLAYLLTNLQTSRASNSKIHRIKNVEFSGYCFYMNTNISGGFQICISVSLKNCQCYCWKYIILLILVYFCFIFSVYLSSEDEYHCQKKGRIYRYQFKCNYLKTKNILLHFYCIFGIDIKFWTLKKVFLNLLSPREVVT